MKKITTTVLAVLMLGVFASAQQPAQGQQQDFRQMRGQRMGDMRGPGMSGGQDRQQMMAQFKERMDTERALHDEYASAKDKKASDKKITDYVTKDVNDMDSRIKNRIDQSDKRLKDAKEQYSKFQKNKKDIISKRVQNIKDGKIGPQAGKDGMQANCENGKCPFQNFQKEGWKKGAMQDGQNQDVQQNQQGQQGQQDQQNQQGQQGQ